MKRNKDLNELARPTMPIDSPSVDKFDEESEVLNRWIDHLQSGMPPRDTSSNDPTSQLAKKLWEFGTQIASQPNQKTQDQNRFPEIAGYQIRSIIGHGGMGIVYSALELDLNRVVALKVLPQCALSSRDAIKRFRIEVQAAAQLEHPRIVPVYRYGEYGGGLFYTMREIDGIDLSVKLLHPTSDEFGPKADSHSREYRRWAATITKQLAEGLAHSHQQFVIHRDVKPANIIIDRNGDAFLSDFGLARLNENSSLTGDHDVLGTVLYMSPEQTTGNGNVGTATDIYSLGTTLYELLTLKPMISANSAVAALKQISDAGIPSPRARNPAIEHDLATIVLKAIAPEPEHRYHSSIEFAEDLQLFLDSKPIKAKRATFALKASRWTRRNAQWVAALTAIMSAAMIFILVFSIINANRAARDAVTIRNQAAQLLDERGVDQLLNDEVSTAKINFEKVVGLAVETRELNKQERRLDAIDAFGFQRLQDKIYPEGLIAQHQDGTYLFTRKEHGAESCVLVNSRGEHKLFETFRTIEFATFGSNSNKIAIIVGDRSNRDPELKLYDAEKNHLSTLSSNSWRLSGAWFIENDEHLLTTGWGGEVRLHSLAEEESSENSLRVIQLPESGNNSSWVYSAELSRNQKRLGVVINPGKLFVYDLPSLQPVWENTVDLHDWSVNALAMSAQGRWIATGTDLDGVRLWHVEKAQEIVLNNNLAGAPTMIQFSEDEQKLIAGDNRGDVYVWDLPTPESISELPQIIPRNGTVMHLGGGITAMQINARDEVLISNGDFVQVWRLFDNLPMTSKLSIGSPLIRIRWLADGKLKLLTRKANGIFESLYELPLPLQTIQEGDGDLHKIFDFSPQTEEMSIGIYETADVISAPSVGTALPKQQARVLKLPTTSAMQSLPFVIGESRIVFLSKDEDNFRIHSLDRAGLQPIGEPTSVSTWFDDIHLNSKETHWIANDFTKYVIVGRVETGEIEQRLAHPNWIEDARFIGDSHFASICWDQKLRIWDHRGSEIAQFELAARPTKMQSQDNFLLVSSGKHLQGFTNLAGNDQWQEVFHQFHDGEQIQNTYVCSSNHIWLSSGARSRNRLWTSTGRLIAEFSSEGPIVDCCFSDNGRWFATLDEAGGIQLRCTESGELMAPRIRGRSPIRSISWFQHSLIFGGNLGNRYWLSSIAFPESWLEESN